MFFLANILGCFVTGLLYIGVAHYFNIIDHPNHRSSHTRVTIRGGGILFPLAAVAASMYSGEYYWFAAGLLIISLISFMDDLNHVPNLLRSAVHLASVALLLYQVDLPIALYWFIPIVILVIGAINAWNFMDGINGITGAYSLVTIGTFYYVQEYSDPFTDTYLLLAVIAALLVFNYFNFRKKAKCFAGDVGSVSIAFICCFLMTQLISDTGSLIYLGLFLVYGLDVVSTILFRLIRKENIFEAHRSHFYQFLANERRLSHLWVTSLYATLQLVINMGIIGHSGVSGSGLNFVPLLIVSVVSACIFTLIRFKVEGKERLMGGPARGQISCDGRK